MNKEYDVTIKTHYKKEAEKHGLDSSSTMLDRMIRQKEIFAIITFLEEYLGAFYDMDSPDRKVRILEIGCGNGFLLSVLRERFPDVDITGIDITQELVDLALTRFDSLELVNIFNADIRDENFVYLEKFDVIISERVFINILDKNDQIVALKNVIEVMNKPRDTYSGSRIITIESYIEPLELLNKAREELDLPQLDPTYHNLYLDSSFFKVPELKIYTPQNLDALSPNFLSTNYFIARVLYPKLKSDESISRNSELVNFFVDALKENVGNYAPLKVYCYNRV